MKRLSPEGLTQMRTRAIEIAAKSLARLEKKREEAQARGEQVEVERLDKLLGEHRQRMENMRATQAAAAGLPAPPTGGLPAQ